MDEYDPHDHPVDGFCPMCGSEKLCLSFGDPTCMAEGCPNPTAIGEILQDKEIEHVVYVTENSWVIRHPLRERLGNQLVECDLGFYIDQLWKAKQLPVGRIRMTNKSTEGSIMSWKAIPFD